MRRILPPLSVVVMLVWALFASTLSGLHQLPADAQSLPTPIANCQPNGNAIPEGQSPSDDDPMRPIWCYPLVSGPNTQVVGPNSWSDKFVTGVDMQHLADREHGYRVFESTSSGRIKTQMFVDHDYWQTDMVDTSPYALSGGNLLSPDRAFAFDRNGRLVLEADAAPGNWNTGGADVFYELDVSPAAAPGVVVDNSYGYGQFGGFGSIGCRLQRLSEGGVIHGASVCSQYDNSFRDADGVDMLGGPHLNPGRVWETQGALNDNLARINVQRDPTGFWHQCAPGQADELCRDHFRLELTKDSLKLYVNGFLQRDIEGMYASNPSTDSRYAGRDNRVPDAWFGPNGVHVYLTSWINSGQHNVQRFKWGDIAVNPDAATSQVPTATPTRIPPSATSTALPTRTPLPTLTSTPTPTQAPVSTSTATPVPATPTPTQTPPAPSDVCAVQGFRNGNAEMFPFPCP